MWLTYLQLTVVQLAFASVAKTEDRSMAYEDYRIPSILLPGEILRGPSSNKRAKAVEVPNTRYIGSETHIKVQLSKHLSNSLLKCGFSRSRENSYRT